jgi:HEAT repeat protein
MIDAQKFLDDLKSSDKDVRFAAWRKAGEAPASTIPELGRLMGGRDPGVAKAAKEALTTMAHSVGKETSAANRAAVVQGLIGLAQGAGPVAVRAHAVWLLSHVGGDESVPAAAKLLLDAALREEAAFCLERIPGAAPEKALLAAYKSVPDDFKPRILYALGHRRVKEAAALCRDAAQSKDKNIALAALRAYGRIGEKVAPVPAFADPAGMTGYDKFDALDSLLRFADARAAQGDTAEAMRIYRIALARPEEHMQCAAVIGLAKLGAEEAAAALMPALKSGNRRVRITAQQAWKRMAG